MSPKLSERLETENQNAEPPFFFIMGFILAAVSISLAKQQLESWTKRTLVGKILWVFESAILSPIVLTGLVVGAAMILIEGLLLLPGIALEHAENWYRANAYKKNGRGSE